MTIARDLARFSMGLKFEELPKDVIQEAKRAVLDTIGCAIGGYSGDASRIIRDLSQELGGEKESTIIGSGMQTSCLNAILANGVMVRYLDFNDTYLIPVGNLVLGNHPSEVIPAVFALAERERLNGRDVVNTIVMGYELSGRFNDCCAIPGVAAPTIEAKGWNTDTRGAFVMPIVAGRLLGLTEAQIEQAIGISGSHNMILGILDATGEEYSMTKNLRFPRTAHGGVLAAMMAKRGYTGPTRVLEGKKGFIQSVMQGDFNIKALTEPIGKFKILETMYKAVAADATTHGHVNATLQLVKERDIKPEDVVEVRIKAGSRCVEHTGDPVKRYPKNKESADHSSYYLTAIAIIDRQIGPNQYTPGKWNDPKVLALIDKVKLEADPSLDSFGRAGISEIRTKQGNVYVKRVEYPAGDPKNPMTDRELEDKLRGMAEPYMTDKRIDRLIQTVYALDKLDNLDELMQCMTFDRKAS
jgi:2-methylcitrate dehydratase